NLVQSSGTSENRTIALLGVSDLCVVDTGDALLVMPRSRSQDVRLVVEALKERDETLLCASRRPQASSTSGGSAASGATALFRLLRLRCLCLRGVSAAALEAREFVAQASSGLELEVLGRCEH